MFRWWGRRIANSNADTHAHTDPNEYCADGGNFCSRRNEC
jgi:hypothetical protein